MTNPTTPLTGEQLDDIEQRATAATPGPWGSYQYGAGGSLIEVAADLHETGCGYRARREICRLEAEPLDNDPTHQEWTAEEDWAQVQADAAFIAHAPEDVPALLAEIRRLSAVLEEIRHLHKDSPMGPCPVCVDADAAAAGGDGLVPFPCPTARLAGAQDCDPPNAPAAAAGL